MKFPREVWWGSHLQGKGSLPRQIVYTKDEYVKFIEMNNNKVNCYTSVYDYKHFGSSQAVVSSVILDRLFLDFDSHTKPLEDSFTDFKIVANKLLHENYIFDMAFSGNGFHIFVYGEQTDTMRNIRQFFNKLNTLTIMGTLDNRVIDARRLRRIPNTVNMKTNDCLYCVPLEKDCLEKPLSNILSLAQTPLFNPPIRYGNRKVVFPKAPSFEATPINLANVEKVGKIPLIPCLANSIMIENPTHTTRYYLVSWYRTVLANTFGVSVKIYDEEIHRYMLEAVMEEIKVIAAKDGVWLDWNENITRNHAWFTISNQGGYVAPSCSKLISEDYCVGKCWRYPSLEDIE
jgi:hypothetical protein